MEGEKIPENQPLSVVVKEVLEIDDCDLIKRVIDKLVSPPKRISKKTVAPYLHQK